MRRSIPRPRPVSRKIGKYYCRALHFQRHTGKVCERGIPLNRRLGRFDTEQSEPKLSDAGWHVTYDVQAGSLRGEDLATASRVQAVRPSEQGHSIYGWDRRTHEGTCRRVTNSSDTRFDNVLNTRRPQP